MPWFVKTETIRVSREQVRVGPVWVPARSPLGEATFTRIEGPSVHSLRLMYRHGVSLLGVSRHGKRITERVRHLEIHAGDILLLLGERDRLQDIVGWLGCLPLADRGLAVTNDSKVWFAIGLFGAAVAATVAMWFISGVFFSAPDMPAPDASIPEPASC